MKKFLLLIITACVFLSSCDIQMVSPDDTGETLPVIATTESPGDPETEPHAFPVVVNDVTIEKSPQKIVSLSPSHTEILFEMGYGDRVVGKGSYCDFPENVLSITDVGRPSKPDLNTIISLAPDVLFTATVIPLKDCYKLEENNIKVIYIPYPSSVEEFRNTYSAFGLILEGIFDGEATGEKYFEIIEKKLTDSKIELGDYIYVTEGLLVATGDTFESSVLSLFGTNVAENSTDYSYPKEYLLEFQPETILINDIYTLDDLMADEIYSQLDAVINGNVYYINNSYFERPSARLIELVEGLVSVG